MRMMRRARVSIGERRGPSADREGLAGIAHPTDQAARSDTPPSQSVDAIRAGRRAAAEQIARSNCEAPMR